MYSKRYSEIAYIALLIDKAGTQKKRQGIVMVIICSFPVFISALLIAAHFYRNGFVLAALLCLLCPFLLFLKSRWIPKLISLFLLLASLEWSRTLFNLINAYKSAGLPYGRLTIILTSVILFTMFSALVLKSKTMKARYSNLDNKSLTIKRWRGAGASKTIFITDRQNFLKQGKTLGCNPKY